MSQPKLKPEFIRKGRMLINLNTGERRRFDSVNAAKRESRALQLSPAGHGLGFGRVAVQR